MIIARYITKEVLYTWVAITGILLLITLSNRFAVYLAKAATGELPISLVFRLVGLYTPELLSLVIPLSFFIAVLFAYGRLHVDSEMIVLWASGFGWKYISQLTFVLSIILMTGVGLLTLWIVPQMTAHRDQVVSEGDALAVIQSTLPGRFQTLSEGRMVFYLEDIDTKDKALKGIFIAEQPNQISAGSQGWVLITAKTAHVRQDAQSKDFYLVLTEGYRYQGMPGAANYTMVKFDEYGRAVKQETSPQQSGLKQKSSGALWQSKALEDKAEFQWRLSIPLSLPILGLLAVPLSHVHPRQGRFGRFLPAVILYIVYYNLFTIAKRWVASGSLPSSIGVWWVHGLFLALAFILLAKEANWFWSYRQRRLANRTRE